MVMKRYPHGASGEFFFMKRAPSPRPDWIEICSIEHASGNVIGTVGIDFARNSDAEQAKITERAKQIGTELEAKLKSKAKMFEFVK